MKWIRLFTLLLLANVWVATIGTITARADGTAEATIPQANRVEPGELAATLGSTGDQPVILQVGSHVLFSEAHIRGALYAGPAGVAAGLENLRRHVDGLARDRPIVIYCGCCPWSHCPNIAPAFRLLHEMGFTSVKALHLANNFGDDWVARGYPVDRGG